MTDLKDAGLTEAPPKTLLEALLAFQRDATNLKLGKDATNPHFRSKYLTLEKLHDAVIPVLTKHNLVWITLPMSGEGSHGLFYELHYAPANEKIEGIVPLIGAGDMQKLGSAITYARRYALLSVLGLVADEDDDGEAASQPIPQAAKATPLPPRKPRVINRVEGEKLMSDVLAAGITLAKAYEYADIDPKGGITHEQALKIRHLIKERGERDNA